MTSIADQTIEISNLDRENFGLDCKDRVQKTVTQSHLCAGLTCGFVCINSVVLGVVRSLNKGEENLWIIDIFNTLQAHREGRTV